MVKSNASKLSITLKPEVLQRADRYANENAISRSALIGLALTQYLDAVEAMPSVNKLLSAMAAVADGTIKGDLVPSEADARMRAIQASYDALTKKK